MVNNLRVQSNSGGIILPESAKTFILTHTHTHNPPNHDANMGLQVPLLQVAASPPESGPPEYWTNERGNISPREWFRNV